MAAVLIVTANPGAFMRSVMMKKNIAPRRRLRRLDYGFQRQTSTPGRSVHQNGACVADTEPITIYGALLDAGVTHLQPGRYSMVGNR